MKFYLLFTVPILTAFLVATITHSQTFESIGFIGGVNGFLNSRALAISADGSTVVGNSSVGMPGPFAAIKWTRSNGLQQITPVATGNGFFATTAIATSNDGSVIVGASLNSENLIEGFVLQENGNVVGTGDLAGGSFRSFANGVSGDGMTVVGQGITSTNRDLGFQWTSKFGISALPDLAGGTALGKALGISIDGTVIVGTGNQTGKNEAAFWRNSGSQILGLGFLPGGEQSSSVARDANYDGSVIVGTSATPNGTRAFRWSDSTGLVDLGLFPDGTSSGAQAVSADGSVIVGDGGTDGGRVAMLWTEDTGMVKLSELLGDAIPVGWQLTSATDISAEGTIIAGQAMNPEGFLEGFVANLEGIVGGLKVGDYNGDGEVGQADLDLVLLNWGDKVKPSSWLAPSQLVGFVNQNELDGVLLNWGGGTSPNLSAIPEPTALATAALLASGTAFRRRHYGR